jgi:hypothetical protein
MTGISALVLCWRRHATGERTSCLRLCLSTYTPRFSSTLWQKTDGPRGSRVAGGWAVMLTRRSYIIDVCSEAELFNCLWGTSKNWSLSHAAEFRITQTPQPATGIPFTVPAALLFSSYHRRWTAGCRFRDAEVVTVIWTRALCVYGGAQSRSLDTVSCGGDAVMR